MPTTTEDDDFGDIDVKALGIDLDEEPETEADPEEIEHHDD